MVEPSAWGVEADAVADGHAALARLRDAAGEGRPYDLAILDMQMPDIDGLDTARMIQAVPAIAGTPVVVLTSLGQALPEASAAGVRAWLAKPARPSLLRACLASILASDADAADAASPRGPGAPADPAVGQGAACRGRLLLAEDNAVNQKVAVRMLERLGFRVDAVANGLEAVQAVRSIPYAAVLMDCQMPELDGYAATAEIRRAEGAGRRTPIIAMTASAMHGDRERCLAAGMDDYVSKPIRPDELAASLARWVPEEPAPEGASAAPAPASAEPVLDEAVLASLGDPDQGGDPDFLAELIDVFVEDAERLLDHLADAVRRGDAPGLARAAHTLKSSSGNLGARRLQRACAEAEAAGRAGRLADVATLLDTVREEHAAARGALLARRRTVPA